MFQTEDRLNVAVLHSHRSQGKPYKRCLETNVADQAERKAKEIIELVLSDRIEELDAKKLRGAVKKVTRPREIATLGNIDAAYLQVASVFVKARSVNDNLNSLRLLVREGLGKPKLTLEETNRLRCSVLTGDVVARFEVDRLRAVGAADDQCVCATGTIGH